MKSKLGRWLVLPGLIVLAGFLTASCSSDPPPGDAGALSQPENRGTGEVPLVTLGHWKDSTPGERYAFLIGFVTMLELEKEWQGRVGGRIMPFEQSLVESWTIGFANRPLSEIYNGLNQYLAAHPDELDRPVAEVMWFIYVKPRLDDHEQRAAPLEDKNSEETGRASPPEGP